MLNLLVHIRMGIEYKFPQPISWMEAAKAILCLKIQALPSRKIHIYECYVSRACSKFYLAHTVFFYFITFSKLFLDNISLKAKKYLAVAQEN